ncbi:MAG TPA: ferritin-like domain-containing protein [Sphingomonas sanguinis]|uniref:ferritin-like domain-containing protein n=1 Tax=Sphingomonas sanguinis TaxID=33051 RepID=UPI002ABF7410|nr:ferritin-like domain-containing protein [Sphingomonas sanguinis]
MSEERFILDVIEEASAKRRTERRRFMRMAAGAGAVGGLAMLGACGDDGDNVIVVPTPTPTASATGSVTDADVLNFALQLEYLEAQFYSYAAFGTGLSSSLLGGTGTQGSVAINTSASGGAGQPRQVQFQDPIVAQYAREIAYDEIAHVTFLRNALGSAAVAQPSINLSGDANGAFTAAARAAKVVGDSATFDPYASDEAFLLGAFLFEDVGVTAYMGGVSLLTNKTFIGAAAGIHAAEAYHAGLVRTTLYRKGVSTTTPISNPLPLTSSSQIPSGALIAAAGAISDARDSLDGSTDLDQGIVATVNGTQVANIVPADSNAIAFVRTPGQVLNVVYLNKAAVTGGGFFPSGLNGNVRTSAASG